MAQEPVVVGIDGSPAAEDALVWGLEVASRYGVPVEAVRAWEWNPPVLEVVLPDVRVELAATSERAVHAELDKCLANRPAGAQPVQASAHAVQGDPRAVLLAASTRARLVVVGRHGIAEWRRRLLGASLGVGIGSVTGACLTRSSVPTVVVTRDKTSTRSAAEPPDRIVVGVDGSDASIVALRWAVAHAAAVGAPVVATLAWQLTTLPSPEPRRADWSVPPLSAWEDEARLLLAQTVTAAGSPDPLEGVSQLLLHRTAAAGLLESVGPDDLLVLGERGRGGFSRLLLGSVSRQCVEHAPCTVVVVPGPGAHRFGHLAAEPAE